MNNKTIIEFGFRIIWRIMDISDGLDEEIITKQQSGFRSLLWTTTLLEATDSWIMFSI